MKFAVLLLLHKNTTIMGQPATIFVDDNPGVASADEIANGTVGIYNSEDNLITSSVKLTYGKGYAPMASGYTSYVQSAQFSIEELSESYKIALYINSDSRMGGKEFVDAQVNLDLDSAEAVEKISGLGGDSRLAAPYAVETMTFTVSELKNTYNLAVYVTAFNTTAISGMQFPYTSTNGKTSNAVLTINKEESYTATLSAAVSMGTSEVEFCENLLDGIEIVENDDDTYTITLTFCFGTVNMPYGNVMTGYMNGASNTDYFGNVVNPKFGYYDGETLVTDGVTLTYNRVSD